MLLLLLPLAGCLGDGPDAPGDARRLTFADGTQLDVGEGEPAPQPQPGHGAISGLVVDRTIKPVPNATVRMNGTAAAATGLDGVFTLVDVLPGVHVLDVAAPGFHDGKGFVRVEVGQEATVKVVLERRFVPTPYNESFRRDFHIPLWAATASRNVDGLVEDAFCACTTDLETDDNGTRLVVDMAWDPSLPDPAGLGELVWSLRDEADWRASKGCAQSCRHVVDLPSNWTARPLALHVRGSDFFVGHQQNVRVIVTVFYNGEAPEGLAASP